jgi:O-antigen ligase
MIGETMVHSIRMNQISNIFLFFIMIIISWEFKASYFSYALILFVLFLMIDGYYSFHHQLSFLPKRNKTFYVILLGILSFYLAFNFTSLMHWTHIDLVKSMDYTWLCFPFFMTWWILSKYDAERGFRWGILVGAVIACVIGLHQWCINPGIRIESSYAHPNHFGTMINLTLPLIGYYAVHVKNNAYKILSVCTMIVQLGCLYLTGSRGALLALIGAVVLGMLWAYVSLREYKNIRFGKYACVFIILILIGGGFTLYHMGQERNLDVVRMAETGDSVAKAGGERMQMIRASIAMWEDHKLFGVGAGHWGEAYYGQYRPSDIHEEGHSMPHNMPLFFLSTGGLVGAAGYCIFIILSIVALTKVVKMGRSLKWGIAVYMIFLSFFLQGLVDTTIINKIPARMYFALMGSFIPLCYLHLKQK